MGNTDIKNMVISFMGNVSLMKENTKIIELLLIM